MTFKGLGEMFEGDSADPGARNPIGASGILSTSRFFPKKFQYLFGHCVYMASTKIVVTMFACHLHNLSMTNESTDFNPRVSGRVKFATLSITPPET
jgi:hypothetical protein